MVIMKMECLTKMAIDNVDGIARALQEYQTGIPVATGASPQQIYSDLALGGLKDAPIFSILFPVGNSDRERISNRYDCEGLGRRIGQGTSNEQFPSGQPCN